MFYKKPLFREFFILLVIVGITHHIAQYLDLYWGLEEFDSLMHFLGGALFSLGTIWLYFFSGFFAPKKRSLLNFFFVSVLGVVFVSVSWEIFELVNGIAVYRWSDYPFDTTLDYVMDFLGGMAACLYAYMREMPLVVFAKKVEAPPNLPI